MIRLHQIAQEDLNRPGTGATVEQVDRVFRRWSGETMCGSQRLAGYAGTRRVSGTDLPVRFGFQERGGLG